MSMTLLNTPLFGIGLTFVIALFSLYLKKKINYALFNPMLFSMLSIIALLSFFEVPYEDYAVGGEYIMKLLGPITVVLAVPLYQHHKVLKEHALAILLGVGLGAFVALVSVYFFSHILSLDALLMRSLLPRSVTTPIGIEASEMLDAIVGLTLLSIVVTGTFGAIVASWVFKVFRIKTSIARGVALGTSAHAIGTGRAFEFGALEGAMAGLSIAITGVYTLVWLLLFQWSGLL